MARRRSGSKAARVAWLYYLEGMTQEAIARELGISRSTVVRLIRQAKEMGLVRITMAVPHERFEKERKLEQRYGLKVVRLVPETSDNEALKRWLGKAAAELLEDEEFVSPGTTVAVTWGTTLQKMTNSLERKRQIEGVQIVPVAGGLHRVPSESNPYSVAEQLGRSLGARVNSLHVPGFVEHRATAQALMRDKGIQETIELARQAKIVIYSLGTLDREATIVKVGYLSKTERELLKKRGAVGDISFHWIDIQGMRVEPPETINTIGISSADLKEIPVRFAVAGGPAKREAVLGTLRGGYATVLVTDESTAEYLLQA